MAQEVIDLLQDLSEFLADLEDVVDGSYGIPAPNRAMQLRQRIEELLE